MKAMKTAICALALVGGVFAYADGTNAVEVGNCASYTPFTDLNGEKVLINDRTYVLLGEDEFDKLVLELKMYSAIAAKRWKIQHKTEQGRVEWHGKKVGTTFDEKAKTKTTEYEDGYKHIEPFTDIAKKREIKIDTKLAEPVRVDKFKKPRRLREFEKKAEQGVTINHEVR